MKKLFKPIIPVLAAVFIFSCTQSKEENASDKLQEDTLTEQDTATNEDNTEKSCIFDAFREFQTYLKEGDPSKMAEKVTFPLKGLIDKKEDIKEDSYGSKEDFIKNYSNIFFDELVTFIVNADEEELKKTDFLQKEFEGGFKNKDRSSDYPCTESLMLFLSEDHTEFYLSINYEYYEEDSNECFESSEKLHFSVNEDCSFELTAITFAG